MEEKISDEIILRKQIEMLAKYSESLVNQIFNVVFESFAELINEYGKTATDTKGMRKVATTLIEMRKTINSLNGFSSLLKEIQDVLSVSSDDC